MPKQIEPIADRFWRYVNKDGPVPESQPELGPCWVWTGNQRHKFGYGVIWEEFPSERDENGKTKRKRRLRTTHRVGWEVQVGEIPDGVCILHKCDNPGCVRADHLMLGTHRDNVQDMAGKGRSNFSHTNRRRGDEHPRAGGIRKLKEHQVDVVRSMYLHGIKQNEIADRLGVSTGAICFVVTGRTWKQYGNPELISAVKAKRESMVESSSSSMKIHGIFHHNAKFTPEVVLDIVRKHREGRDRASLSREYGVTYNAITSILTGNSWSHVTGIKPRGGRPSGSSSNEDRPPEPEGKSQLDAE